MSSQRIDMLLHTVFALHDFASGFLAKHLMRIKTLLLLLAHFSLIGLAFPQILNAYGNLAIAILFVILFLSPLSKIFRMRFLIQLMSLRREFGILFGYLAMVHGMGYFLDSDWFGTFIASHINAPLSIYPRYLFGILALMLTLPLLITSNNISLRLLKTNWKKVHFLVYPMFLFVLIHYFYPRRPEYFYEVFGFVQAGIVFGGYVFLKLLARKNFLSFLVDINTYVTKKYTEYSRAHNL